MFNKKSDFYQRIFWGTWDALGSGIIAKTTDEQQTSNEDYRRATDV